MDWQRVHSGDTGGNAPRNAFPARLSLFSERKGPLVNHVAGMLPERWFAAWPKAQSGRPEATSSTSIRQRRAAHQVCSQQARERVVGAPFTRQAAGEGITVQVQDSQAPHQRPAWGQRPAEREWH